MSRLVLQDSVTVDGFAANLRGEVAFLDPLAGSLDEFTRHQLEWLDGIEAMVLGSRTRL